MTPVFKSKNKTLIITPGKFIRIYHTPQHKIDKAEKLVLQALDRKLPFAYLTVRPMYYLELKHTYQNQEHDTVWEYEHKVSLDRHTRKQFYANYHKLRNALRFLEDECIVKSWVCLPDNPALRVKWYTGDEGNTTEIQTIDYGAFPPDYVSPPHKPRFQVKRAIRKQIQAEADAITAMRSAFPLGEVKQGMVDKDYVGPQYKVTPDDPGYTYNGMVNARDVLHRDIYNESNKNMDKAIRDIEYRYEVFTQNVRYILLCIGLSKLGILYTRKPNEKGWLVDDTA